MYLPIFLTDNPKKLFRDSEVIIARKAKGKILELRGEVSLDLLRSGERMQPVAITVAVGIGLDSE